MIVVSNTSPIINLAAIDHLDILQELYTNLIIPEAVYSEIIVAGTGQPGSHEVKTFSWINTKTVKNKTLVEALKMELDDGEAETISLALEVDSDWLLIDERIGRNVASRFSLKYIGVLGIIVEAKSKGLIPKVRPLLDDLKSVAGFWIADGLYSKILSVTRE